MTSKSKILTQKNSDLTIEPWQMPELNEVGALRAADLLHSVNSPKCRLTKSLKEQERYLFEQAQKQGYHDGTDRAMKEVQAKLQQEYDQKTLQLLTLHQNLTEQFTQLEENFYNILLEWSVFLAKKIILHELHTSTETLQSLITQIMTELHVTPGQVEIQLNEDDYNSLEKSDIFSNQSEKGVRFSKNQTLSRGGCLVVSPLTRIDAQLETRLQELCDRVLTSQSQAS